MTYTVTDFWGQVIAQYLTKDGAIRLAISDGVTFRGGYRAVHSENGEKVFAVWPSGKIE
jgi:hypothetical protein